MSDFVGELGFVGLFGVFNHQSLTSNTCTQSQLLSKSRAICLDRVGDVQRSHVHASIHLHTTDSVQVSPSSDAEATSVLNTHGESDQEHHHQHVLSHELVRQPPVRAKEVVLAETMDQVRALLHVKQVGKARDILQKLADSTNRDPRVLRMWGWLEGRNGNLALGRSLFSEAIKSASGADEAAAWSAWAMIEQRAGNLSGARKCFVNGLRADPAHVPIYQSFAIFEGRFGDTRRSRELFSRACKLQPDCTRSLLAWAAFESRELNHATARSLYWSAIKAASPEDVVAKLAYAQFEQKSKKIDLSRAMYREILEQHPKNVKALHSLANLEAHSGDYTLAENLFKKCLKCHEEHDVVGESDGSAKAAVYQAWALMEKRRRRLDKARMLLAKGAEADPTHSYIWQAWGLLEEQTKNYEAARQYFAKGLDTAPDCAPILQVWARMEAKCKQYSKAREFFKRATDVNPSHAQSWQAWGVFESKQNNLELARELFRRTLLADPKNAPAYQAWALLEERENNFELARDLFQKGVDACPDHSPVWQAWALMEARLCKQNPNPDSVILRGPACSLQLPDQSKIDSA
uniref:PsbB mRNA maturation factor Mbb1, chloroplastic n=1 Tax=Timspurckia oligopyrenoides TaxID=708627 RepID=A0A7S1ESH8_9RHOD|mmetsp:Transcript_4524/g.7919  ORF Transcript_4524/g.7919 Transcript_4524/m.7919 type:complete len:577 (+) Transcript_4524:150-1880(+)|eukprot:CAMPEP_0182447664 /NCGR_PEP_ID=MMETSP1172-20130603/18461_1 /TAXON_ID=708627 /ORGANISM="Timspurckia oligopyrenoides, Strain CCMP3278" /LENGTH=576 /DNA_ID=CAMNT_0024644181 /DNA_START=86 /DNA_END=1816 /DNA_ORIENTATION=-